MFRGARRPARCFLRPAENRFLAERAAKRPSGQAVVGSCQISLERFTFHRSLRLVLLDPPSVTSRIAPVILVSALFVLGCDHSPPGYREEFLQISSGALQKYPALFSIDRKKMGFPELPTSGEVRILTVDRRKWNLEYPPPNYDVSFQIYETSASYHRTSRFVALKLVDGKYRWVSEQLTFDGPKKYMPDESEINEYITISCETEQVTVIGANQVGTMIRYSGPTRELDTSGLRDKGLTISQIGPVLREWGYSYDLDNEDPADSLQKTPQVP
jgi:hypothetical protein